MKTNNISKILILIFLSSILSIVYITYSKVFANIYTYSIIEETKENEENNDSESDEITFVLSVYDIISIKRLIYYSFYDYSSSVNFYKFLYSSQVFKPPVIKV
ncbi:MAG: hypothetical protein AB1304_09060 [Bacteroidota bacterium]